MNKNSKGQLVCQHVEKISRRLLEEYPGIIRQFVRRRHGIYALYRGDHLHYVGLASNLRSRLRIHLRDRHGKTWDRFSIYLTLSDAHLRELESLVLRIASPKGNVIAGKFLQSQDLRRQIQVKIHEIKRQEQRELLGDEISHTRIIQNIRKKDAGVLAQYTTKRIHIRMRFKGKLYIAHIRRDGWIIFDPHSAEYYKLKGKKFKSPSGAAAVISGHSMHGWHWWKYERSPGEWVQLDELRKR